jgi:predicted Rossmann fold flavoprotein
MNDVAEYDVIVIGAGAAGLLAACRSAERGRSTLLIEKNRKAGVKILISGGTRCNLTHDCDEQGIRAAFGSAGNFLHSPLAALGPRELIELFHAEGMLTYVERDTGKIFPLSDSAVDVVQALLRRLERSGAQLALGEGVTDVARNDQGFRVTTAARVVDCQRLIVATGGKSYPGCGTTGDGYRWLAAWGHTIRKPRPALVPLTSNAGWVRDLSGIAIPDCVVRVVDRVAPTGVEAARQKRRRGLPAGVRIERRGALLFTHLGLSGPAALDVSREVTNAADPADVLLEVDFLPNLPAAQLDELLRNAAAADGRKQIVSVVPDVLPKRLAEGLLANAQLPLDRRVAELTKTERPRLIDALKRARIAVSGSRGFDKAEVTAGGVTLDEVDSRTMQSKLAPNLYLVGEILDLDGFIGGYNFQAAFSTGWLAGSSV